MDDELEDKVIYQTYISHMRLLSKLAMGVSPLNSTMAYIWKLLRLYLMRPEVVLFAVLCIIFVTYLHVLEIWSHNVLHRVGSSIGVLRHGVRNYSNTNSPLRSAAERHSWEEIHDVSAVYAVLGRRPRMEDRYVIDENVRDSGVAVFAIFDGHGGEMAADFAKDYFIENLYNKIVDAVSIVSGKEPTPSTAQVSDNKCPDDDTDSTVEDGQKVKANSNNAETSAVQRRASFKKSLSTADDCNGTKGNCNREQDAFLNQLNSVVRTKESFLNTNNNSVKPQQYEARCYIEKNKNINFGKMITDEMLAADFKLVERAKRENNVAGTTALVALVYKERLIVANVGDSRGVMCDVKGNAIPLSFDHKPQQTREFKRIREAGGFIAFKGVWRVAGILATSRAMGDYPLKEKNFVIAEPDILTFDLNDHKPKFIILASDGLWDTFSNEDAVAYIKDRLDEPHFGAKSITIESYNRGSVDNITVLIVIFKNGAYQLGAYSSN